MGKQSDLDVIDFQECLLRFELIRGSDDGEVACLSQSDLEEVPEGALLFAAAISILNLGTKIGLEQALEKLQSFIYDIKKAKV